MLLILVWKVWIVKNCFRLNFILRAVKNMGAAEIPVNVRYLYTFLAVLIAKILHQISTVWEICKVLLKILVTSNTISRGVWYIKINCSQTIADFFMLAWSIKLFWAKRVLMEYICSFLVFRENLKRIQVKTYKKFRFQRAFFLLGKFSKKLLVPLHLGIWNC